MSDSTVLTTMLREGDSAAFAVVPKEESILDGELNGTSARPVKNKAISREVANALKGSESGTAVTLTDVSPLEHEVGVKLKSKNLIPPQSYNDTNPTTSAGVTFTYNEDGSVLANGTATGATAYYVCQGQPWEKQMPLPRGTYTLSGSTENVRLTLGVRTSEGAERVGKSSSAGRPLVFTVDNDTTRVDLVVCVDAGKTADAETVYPQLEAGDTATAYTPHVADFSTASLTKHGKNFFDLSSAFGKTVEANGATFVFGADGSVTVSGIPAAFTACFRQYDFVLPRGVYTASVQGTVENMQFTLYVRSSTSANLATFKSYKNQPITFDLNDYEGYASMILEIHSRAANVELSGTGYFQIEQGTKATAYEPYKEPATYTPTADGTVEGVTSLAPTTTLTTDTDGVTIDATYNRDTNKVIERLVSAIISLGGNV